MFARFRNQIHRPHPLRDVMVMQSLRCGHLQELLELTESSVCAVCEYVDTFDPLPNQKAEDRRQASEKPPSLGTDQIFVIAAEEFIAAVSRQTHSNRLASQLRYQKSWNLGWISKRLIVDARQQRDNIKCVPGR